MAAKSSGGAKAPSSGGAGGSVTKVSYKSPSSNDAPTWRQAYDLSNQQLDRGVEQGRETARQAANAGLQRDRINAGQAAASQGTKTQEMNLGFQNSLMSQKNGGLSSSSSKATGPSFEQQQLNYQRQQGQIDNDNRARSMEQDRLNNHYARHEAAVQANANRNTASYHQIEDRASGERVAQMNAATELTKAKYGMMGQMFGSMAQSISGGDMNYRYW